MEKDLEFLYKLRDEDLNDLFAILTTDTDGKSRITEGLSINEKVKKYNPQHTKYIDEIINELQLYGGNTLVNLARHIEVVDRVSYREIVCDICDAFKITYDKDSDIEKLEFKVVEKTLENSMDKMTNDELKRFAKELKIDNTSNISKQFIMQAINSASSNAVKYIATNLTAKVATSGIISPTAGYVGARTFGLLNPLLTVAATGLAIYGLSKPALRVTIPAVIQIAALRLIYKDRVEKTNFYKEIERLFGTAEEFNDEFESMSEKEKKALKDGLVEFATKNIQLNLLIIGGTGVGKSSTINALFDDIKNVKKAEIGNEHKAQTMTIECYKYKNLTIWDSPGFGDNEDEKHWKKIKAKLEERTKNNEFVIDMILVILDGSSRDYSSAYKLISKIKELDFGEEILKERFLVAINKCDKIGSQRKSPFDYANNKPSPALQQEIDKKIQATKEELKEKAKIDIEPIAYMAGEFDEETNTQESYNLGKLLYHITLNTPLKKRFAFSAYTDIDDKKFASNSGDKDYQIATKTSWWESVKSFALEVKDFVLDAKDVASEAIDWVAKNAPKIATAATAVIKIYDLFSKRNKQNNTNKSPK